MMRYCNIRFAHCFIYNRFRQASARGLVKQYDVPVVCGLDGFCCLVLKDMAFSATEVMAIIQMQFLVDALECYRQGRPSQLIVCVPAYISQVAIIETKAICM